MRKTHRQQLLELRHRMPLEDFIRQTLEQNRGSLRHSGGVSQEVRCRP